jgi:hypothetical protein
MINRHQTTTPGSSPDEIAEMNHAVHEAFSGVESKNKRKLIESVGEFSINDEGKVSASLKRELLEGGHEFGGIVASQGLAGEMGAQGISGAMHSASQMHTAGRNIAILAPIIALFGWIGQGRKTLRDWRARKRGEIEDSKFAKRTAKGFGINAIFTAGAVLGVLGAIGGIAVAAVAAPIAFVAFSLADLVKDRFERRKEKRESANIQEKISGLGEEVGISDLEKLSTEKLGKKIELEKAKLGALYKAKDKEYGGCQLNKIIEFQGKKIAILQEQARFNETKKTSDTQYKGNTAVKSINTGLFTLLAISPLAGPAAPFIAAGVGIAFGVVNTASIVYNSIILPIQEHGRMKAAGLNPGPLWKHVFPRTARLVSKMTKGLKNIFKKQKKLDKVHSEDAAKEITAVEKPHRLSTTIIFQREGVNGSKLEEEEPLLRSRDREHELKEEIEEAEKREVVSAPPINVEKKKEDEDGDGDGDTDGDTDTERGMHPF